MIDFIVIFKFVHVLAAGAMFGAWLGMTIFMTLAHRSGNVSVIALTARFVFALEKIVMAGAIALLPITGLPLGSLIGLSDADQFWIMLSIALYVLVVAAWAATVRIEFRIRNMAQDAALRGATLTAAYRRLFRYYSYLAWPVLAGMVALFAVMVWQPRLS